ncbi:prolyl oligopeptidase family serine peptidase [Pseudochelatococcus sp. G4_1912]|uniref:prolyl oligopeptidase family serine peptidase n=1 Tax=Pseudochelatococcus sp. G4_1912 TaxID=3114288 RepID=UPI0039C63482
MPTLAEKKVINTTDPYQWMETEKEPLKAWFLQQSQQTRNTLDTLPWRKEVIDRSANIGLDVFNPYSITVQKDRHFYRKDTSDHPYGRLFMQEGDKPEQLLLDLPLHHDLTYYVPSRNGHYVAYGLSKNGSEFTTLRIYDVAAETDLPDTIPMVRHPNMNWRSDQQSFFYARSALEGTELPESETLTGKQVYLHRLGENASTDEAVFGVGIASVPEAKADDDVFVITSQSSPWVIGILGRAISGHSISVYAVKADQVDGVRTSWQIIIDTKDNVTSAILHGDKLYIARSNARSGYTITSRSLLEEPANEEAILEFSDSELNIFRKSMDSLYIGYQQKGASKLVRVPLDNLSQKHDIELPFKGTIGYVLSSEDQSDILLNIQGWTEPPALYRYDAKKNVIVDSGIISPLPDDFSPYIAEEKLVPARDGTMIPLTIIRKRDMAFDGSHPTWLRGYGAYGVSEFANFNASRLVWLERGGIIAIAHVRGGGELGPSWHEAGMGPRKINTVHDFIDCAEYLIQQQYTRPDKLVASGQSAGGIMVGMAVALRPDLFAAAAIDVGMLNALRFEQMPIGPFNVHEFGSVSTPEGLRSLQAIDAYQHLQDGVRYPAMLLTVGLNDNRVSPWQSAKFSARLQEINKHISNPNPVLVFAEQNAGHSRDFKQQNDMYFADLQSFFLWQTVEKSLLVNPANSIQ